MRVVAAGNALLSPSVTKKLLDQYAHRLPPTTGRRSAELARVTDRELAVLMLVVQGLSNAKIGEALHLAESSVKSHVGHLLAKLGVTDRVQLVIFAYEKGLIWPGASFGKGVAERGDQHVERRSGRAVTGHGRRRHDLRDPVHLGGQVPPPPHDEGACSCPIK